MKKKIVTAISKFGLNLSGSKVLTEAATGNYAVTPVIAACAGAEVFALAKESKYGTVAEVKAQTLKLAEVLGIAGNITIVEHFDDVPLQRIQILTNTGFLRPIDRSLIEKLNASCVIPLMWEPWEYRSSDLDLEACAEKGIKVYGTNENDKRLRTMEYLGYIVLNFLLNKKISPASGNILLLGCTHFVDSISSVLKNNKYTFCADTSYLHHVDVSKFNAVVVAVHLNQRLIIGENDAFINTHDIPDSCCVIHIAGNVNLSGVSFDHIPEKPAPFGFMSFTTDYIDNAAVIDLHTAGLKVGEGMMKANEKNLTGSNYKAFMETNFPALAFNNSKFW